MPNTLAAQQIQEGLVQLTGTYASTPVNHAALSASQIVSGTTANAAVIVGPVQPSGADYVRFSVGPTTTVRTGKLTRTGGSAFTNARFVLEARLGTPTPAKARLFDANAASPYVELTTAWQTLTFTEVDLSAGYGIEAAPLSPYGQSITVEIRAWRVRDYSAAATLRPVLTRVEAAGVIVPVPMTPAELENGLDAGAFDVLDGTAPAGVAVTYRLSVDGGATVAASVAHTLDAPRPLLSRVDVAQPAVPVDLVMSYTADVTPQQVVHDVVGKAAPAITGTAGSTRSGRLSLFFADIDGAHDALAVLGGGGRLMLRQDIYPDLNIRFVAIRSSLSRAPSSEDIDVPPWVVDLEYREV